MKKWSKKNTFLKFCHFYQEKSEKKLFSFFVFFSFFCPFWGQKWQKYEKTRSIGRRASTNDEKTRGLGQLARPIHEKNRLIGRRALPKDVKTRCLGRSGWHPLEFLRENGAGVLGDPKSRTLCSKGKLARCPKSRTLCSKGMITRGRPKYEPCACWGHGSGPPQDRAKKERKRNKK